MLFRSHTLTYETSVALPPYSRCFFGARLVEVEQTYSYGAKGSWTFSKYTNWGTNSNIMPWPKEPRTVIHDTSGSVTRTSAEWRTETHR